MELPLHIVLPALKNKEPAILSLLTESDSVSLKSSLGRHANEISYLSFLPHSYGPNFKAQAYSNACSSESPACRSCIRTEYGQTSSEHPSLSGTALLNALVVSPEN
jgi:hypothetical protein